MAGGGGGLLVVLLPARGAMKRETFERKMSRARAFSLGPDGKEHRDRATHAVLLEGGGDTVEGGGEGGVGEAKLLVVTKLEPVARLFAAQ